MKPVHWRFPSVQDAKDAGLTKDFGHHSDLFGCWHASTWPATITTNSEEVTCEECLDILADIVERTLT